MAKHSVASILVCVIAVTVFAGCGQSAPSPTAAPDPKFLPTTPGHDAATYGGNAAGNGGGPSTAGHGR